MSISNFDDIRKDLKTYLTHQQIYDIILDSFDTLKLDRDKVELCWVLLCASQLFPDFRCSNLKSRESSEKFRLDGNRFFASKKNLDAIRSYTLAAGYAPQDSKELVLAVANRSAVSSRLNNHINCLKDIDFSLDNDYPENLKYKLLERKGKSLISLNRYESALSTLKDALSSLEHSELTGSKLDKVKTVITDLMDCCPKISNKTDESDNQNFIVPEIPELSYGINELIPCASLCTDIAYSSEMGRHLIATRDISPGDVLAVEKPYVSILLPEAAGLYCNHCLKRCHSLFPCSSCTEVYFCSKECESQAFNRYHRVECGLLKFLLGLGCGKLELLAVRTVIEAANQGSNLKALASSLSYLDVPVDPPTRKGFTNGIYDSGGYAAVHSLEGNSHHRSSMDLFRRAISAACIVEALDRASNFFSHAKEGGIIDTCDETKIQSQKNIFKSFKLLEPYFQQTEIEEIGYYKAITGGLILKYLQVIPSNAHEVSEMLIDRGNNSTESIEIGGALYPFLSLTNHSCDPNVVRHSHNGDVVVLTAIQCIAKGEQIFDNYGYHHAVHDRTCRQTSLLSQYHFYCRCEACLYDWPLYQHMPVDEPSYLIGANTKIVQESSSKFSKVISEILNSNNNELEFLTNHLKLLHTSIIRPHKEYSSCQEAIKQLLSQLANHYII